MSDKIFPGVYYEGTSVKFDLSVYFSEPDAIPVKVFADSIVGMNMLLEESRHAILKILDVDCGGKSVLYLDAVRKGSTIQELAVRFFFGSDEEAQQFVDNLRKKFKIDKMGNKTFISLLIVAAISYCAINVAGKYLDAEKSKIAIDASNSLIINAGHDLNIPPEVLKKTFDECIARKPKACKGALMAIQPATMKSDTVMKVGGKDGVEIPNGVISNMPRPSVIKTTDEPTCYDLDGMSIGVMASDIDKRKSGWAVKLPANSPFPGQRIKAVLDPTVKPSDLMYRKEVTADITIYQDANGKAQHVLIRKIAD